MFDDSLQHTKKRGGKKQFTIERRYLGECGLEDMYHWSVCGRYKTEKRREQAFERLSKRNASMWEYRYGTTL